jgi:hypothetical protein
MRFYKTIEPLQNKQFIKKLNEASEINKRAKSRNNQYIVGLNQIINMKRVKVESGKEMFVMDLPFNSFICVDTMVLCMKKAKIKTTSHKLDAYAKHIGMGKHDVPYFVQH